MAFNVSMDTTEGGFMNDTMETQSKSQPVRGNQNVVPVVISQLLKAQDELVVAGASAHIITFLGVLRNIEESTTKITYEVEDDTGSIAVVRWLEANNASPEPVYKLNSYVRVFGLLRSQHEKKQIFVLSLKPIAHIHELINHLLEVIHLSLISIEGSGNVELTEKGKEESNTSQLVNMSDAECGLTPDQRKVLQIIKQLSSKDESGIERNELRSRVPTNLLGTVDDIINFLVSEGHIYTTKTDDHFKAI